jgi:hypothetical protein
MYIHDSPIAKIEYKKIKNGFIKQDTNIILFKIKKLYNKELQSKYLEQIKTDIFKFYKELLKSKTKFIQIYDLTDTEISTVYHDIIFVKNYGNFLQENVESIIKECCYGTSILVNSEIIKGLINASLLLYRHVTPTQIHTSISDSYEWLGQISDKSLHV